MVGRDQVDKRWVLRDIEPTRGFQEMIPEFKSSFCMENLEESVTNLWSSVTR